VASLLLLEDSPTNSPREAVDLSEFDSPMRKVASLTRVEGSGFRVQGAGFRVEGLGAPAERRASRLVWRSALERI